MSDYEDEGFENYDDEGFEEEEDDEDDYDVLPTKNMSKAATPAPSTPKDIASPQRGAGVRMSYTGNARPPSAGAGHGPAKISRTVDIPAFAGLTDAQRKSAMRKLAGAIKRKKLLKLSVVVMDDFPQLQSLSKYELYNMGRSQYAGVKVASAQTHEDDKEEEQQTEEILCCTYSCQVPEDRNTIFEGEHTLSAGAGGSSSGSSGAVAMTPANRAVMRITAMAPDQESKLMSFMRWAGPIMLAALGMNPTDKKVAIQPFGSVSDMGLSAGTAKLGRQQEALLAQRPVTGVAFCPGPSPLLLASYAPVGAQLGAAALLQDHTLGSKGMMCVWDLSAPSAPSAVMVSEGSPSCCCWAPAPSTCLVFAGMEEGGVCAWDMEEPEARHQMEVVGGVTYFLRRPSYTTEYLADVATTAAPIVGIATTPRTESRSRPCQVVSLNGWGTVTVYTAVLMAPAERNAAEADVGLRPGSRLKLVRTSQISRLGTLALRPQAGPKGGAAAAAGQPVSLDQLVQTYSLQVLPGADMQMLAGSDGGKVLRGSMVGAPPAPKQYVPDDHKSRIATCASETPLASCVTCLSASPFVPHVFLSGHSNGTITLHNVHVAAAAAVWPDVSRGKILVVRWSPLRPAVFFALDSLCMLFTFNLMESRMAPVAMQSFMLKSKQVASLPTYFDIAVVNTGEKSAGGTPAFCVGYDDGLLDVNLLAKEHLAPVENELRTLESFVRENADAADIAANTPNVPKAAAKAAAANGAAGPKGGSKPSKLKAR